jgi:hypothetical protein
VLFLEFDAAPQKQTKITVFRAEQMTRTVWPETLFTCVSKKNSVVH